MEPPFVLETNKPAGYRQGRGRVTKGTRRRQVGDGRGQPIVALALAAISIGVSACTPTTAHHADCEWPPEAASADAPQMAATAETEDIPTATEINWNQIHPVTIGDARCQIITRRSRGRPIFTAHFRVGNPWRARYMWSCVNTLLQIRYPCIMLKSVA